MGATDPRDQPRSSTTGRDGGRGATSRASDTDATVPAANRPTRITANLGGESLTGQVWGDFAVGPLLGRGGMGAVYRGRQQSLDRDVAIKVLPPHLSDNEGFRNRFQLEAKAVAQLDSPHIIKVYGAGEADGHHYFAMEYVEGQDLSATMRSNGKPTRKQAMEWVLQAARGLQAAGELGIVHRDIKPANMMLTRKGVVKLMDFGLVRQASNDSHGMTMTGTVMGTVSYFSPEQGRGERCDQRTDIYALGVVLYEFLTGRLPFTGEDPTSVIYQHIHVAPVPPREIDPSVPEDLQAVCLKCMQKRAEDRYTHASELVSDLELLMRGDHPRINPAELARLRSGTTMFIPGGPAVAPPRRSHLPLVLAVVAVAAIAGATVWALRPRDPQPFAPGPGPGPAPTPVAEHPQLPPTTVAAGTTPTPVAPPPATPVATAPASAQQPTTPAGGSPGAAKVQVQIAAKRYAEARTLLAQERAQHPEDAALPPLAKAIDAAEGAQALAKAKAALAAGDLVGAAAPLDAARALLGDGGEVKAAGDELARRSANVKLLLGNAKDLAAVGKGEEADAALAKARAEAPNHPGLAEAATAVRADNERWTALRAARDAALADGATALAAIDLDKADSAYTEALRLDPASAPGLAGRTAVADKRTQLATLYKAVTDAVAARDLPAAEKADAALVAAAPNHAATAEAGQRVATLREELLQAKRAAEALEAKRAARAAALLAACDELSVPVADLDAELTAFQREAGTNRPERPAIEKKLDVRHQRAALEQRLAQLDQAVLAGDAATINAVVADKAYAAGLAGLAGQAGLVFETTLGRFTPLPAAGAAVRIRHALATFPETTLTYTYELARTADGWTITAAAPAK